MRYTMVLLYGKTGQGALASGPVDAQRCSTCQIEAVNEPTARTMAAEAADRLLSLLVEAGIVTSYRTMVFPTPGGTVGVDVEPKDVEQIAVPPPYPTAPTKYRDGGWDVVSMEPRR